MCISLIHHKIFHFKYLNWTVDEIDPTICGFEEKIGEIEVSR